MNKNSIHLSQAANLYRKAGPLQFPEVTAEAFSAMDTDSDGVLNADETLAGEDAGLIPKTAS